MRTIAFALCLLVPSEIAASQGSLSFDLRDKNGQAPKSLSAEQLTVTEDGAPRPILDLATTPPKPWRVVVYVDRLLTGTRTLKGAAGALAENASRLASLGPVEVVVAEPEPRLALAATRDAAAIDDALSRLWLNGEGRDELRVLRGQPAEEAEDAFLAEIELVRRQSERLTEWLASDREPGPRALFLISDGFDVNPAAGYGSLEDPAGESLEAVASGMAQTLAGLGWNVFPMPLGKSTLPDLGRLRTVSNERLPLGVSIPLKRRKRSGETRVPEPVLPLLRNPMEPLEWMASASGGELLTDARDVGPVLVRLSTRWHLTYEAADEPDGRPRHVEIGLDLPRFVLFAGQWRIDGPPQWIAANRARRVLAGEDEGSDLSLEAALHVEEDAEGAAGMATLELRLEPAPPPSETLRLALVAPEAPAAERSLGEADLAGTEAGVYRVEMPWPEAADRLGLVVERAGGGAWAGDVVFRDPAQERAEVDVVEVLPRPSPRLPIGPGEAFQVRAVVPPGKLAGPVEVEAEVKPPRGGRVAKVEFFWNDHLAGTAYAPPYRYRIVVPPARPQGYLRIEARLTDGTIAEDAVAVNASGLGERLDVRLVELYVVVTDRDGRPVRDLPREAFTLFQDGRPQEITHFENAGELPLTLGLTIDSSASMFLKLADVRGAVAELLGTGLTGRDRALLVDFDTEPRLVQPLTRDLPQVNAALGALIPDGDSNLFEALVYSLGQLRGVAGRKALIVYSDGIGEGEEFPFRESLKVARESSIPVYLIVTNPQAARGEDRGSFLTEPYSDKIRRLADATGGKAYFVLADQDLGPIYREILGELRSQYALAFYPKQDGDVWRQVKVEVSGRGLAARTLSGYEARR